MQRTRPAGPDAARQDLVAAALRLVTISVAFGLLSGAVSVLFGLRARSLGVLAIGLGVLADVAGSAVLIWRFRAEQRQPDAPLHAEGRAAMVVALSLAVVCVVLAADQRSRWRTDPGRDSTAALAAAAVSVAVLTPLAIAKRRLGTRLNSLALRGTAR